jgi:hypothetical protein
MRLAETDHFEPVVEALLAWPLDSPEFDTALMQSTQADRDEVIRRLDVVKVAHTGRQGSLRWRLAELEREYPGIGEDG